MELGKIPPQAQEIEKSVLSVILTEKDAFYRASGIIEPDCFYNPKNNLIFTAIQELASENEAIDMLTVSERLKKKKQLEESGGIFYLSTLDYGRSWQLESHCFILKQEWIKRRIIDSSSQSIKDCYDGILDPLDILSNHERSLEMLTDLGALNRTTPLINGLIEVIEESEAVRNSEKNFVGVPSGLREIDRLTMGWRESDLIVIAARPAMGKTGLMTSMALMASQLNYNVGIISLEMSKKQISQRILSQKSGVDLMKIRNGTYDNDDFNILTNTASELKELPLFIDDSAGVTLIQLKTIVRNMVKEKGCKAVFIDQLNHINHSEKGRSKNDEVGTISRTIKALAKTYEIPIILLHQLSRSVEKRGGEKIPILSDLRDSGNVEQDADMVIFIHRPEYYNILEDDLGSTEGMADLIIAKHRQGSVGMVRVAFCKESASFSNINRFGSGSFDNEKTEWYD